MGGGELAAVQGDLAGIGPDDPAKHLEKGRLAGTVFADDGVDLASTHLDAHIVDGDHAGKDDGEGVDREASNMNRFIPVRAVGLRFGNVDRSRAVARVMRYLPQRSRFSRVHRATVCATRVTLTGLARVILRVILRDQGAATCRRLNSTASA